MTHIKISVIFCYDELRLGFILTVNHIHVESSLLEHTGNRRSQEDLLKTTQSASRCSVVYARV